MARPIAGKFVMRTPEEKERIVLEAIERGARRTAEAHGVDRRLLRAKPAKANTGAATPSPGCGAKRTRPGRRSSSWRSSG